MATIVGKRLLTRDGSEKRTLEVEISLEVGYMYVRPPNPNKNSCTFQIQDVYMYILRCAVEVKG